MRPLLAIAGLWLLATSFAASAAQLRPDTSAIIQDAAATGIVTRIEFHGLRRIRPEALLSQLESREDQPLDPRTMEKDVRALARLGWFEDVTVQVGPLAESPDKPFVRRPDAVPLRIIFHVEERPMLAGVEFKGSARMPAERAEEILAAAGIRLRLAAPVNWAELHRGSRVLRQAMTELAYPDAVVSVSLKAVPGASVRAVFEICEGERIDVARVEFEGNQSISADRLRRQMERIAPHAVFAGVRRKKTYTPEALAADLERVEMYYQDRGWADVVLGAPRAERIILRRWRWPRIHRGELPWPRRRAAVAYRISVPVSEGPRYRIASVEFEGDAWAEGRARQKIAKTLRSGEVYSVRGIQRLQKRIGVSGWFSNSSAAGISPELVVHPEFDPARGEVRLLIRAQPVPPVLVRRIEFLGHKRFSDRYFRRRIGLEEGKPFDFLRLERGLAAMAAAGFIRPAAEDDVRVTPVDDGRAVDLAIRVEEIGRQRVSLVGGAGQLGSTVGVAYQLFNLLGGEEMLAGRIEGGPESLQTVLGLTQDALFGTRISFGIALSRTVLRPAVLTLAGREPLFTTRTDSLGLAAGYPLTRRDQLLLAYEFAGTRSSYPLGGGEISQPADLAPVTTRSSARALTLGWTHSGPTQRFEARTALTGNILGGDEEHIRAAVEYTRIALDPATRGRNSWGFRGYLAGAGALGANGLPLHARYWGGEHLLRGIRTADFAPWIAVPRGGEAGTAPYRAEAAGANVLAVWNVEYRTPLARGTDAAVFLDAGSNWLVPRWLGGARPVVLGGSSGAVRASTGIELRVPLPLVQEKLRLFYAVNPLRAAESWVLPDGSRHRPRHRRALLGWGLGAIF
jgi:outer membrane protein insertion porin family